MASYIEWDENGKQFETRIPKRIPEQTKEIPKLTKKQMADELAQDCVESGLDSATIERILYSYFYNAYMGWTLKEVRTVYKERFGEDG